MATAEMTKQQWVQDYSCRILKMWQNLPGPLGTVDENYIQHLKAQLQEQFDDPLKRSLIETTY